MASPIVPQPSTVSVWSLASMRRVNIAHPGTVVFARAGR